MSVDNEQLQQCMEILNACAKTNSQLRKCWSGDIKSIVSTKLTRVRRLTISANARKREKLMERHPATEPHNPKSEPSSIDLWNGYESEDWIGYSWEHVDDFWEECTSCNGSGRRSCSTCDGTGKVICTNCHGDGTVVESV